MNGVGGVRPSSAMPPASDEVRLRRAAQQMEGVFVQQLFKAMRETIPEGGLGDGGSGEAMFQGMMDEHIAEMVPGRWHSEVGEAIYRQMRLNLAAQNPERAPDGAGEAQG